MAEAFPPALERKLREADEKGEVRLAFESHEECIRERLRMYRFLASCRENVASDLCAIAARTVLQLKALKHEKTKRVLVIKCGAVVETAWDAATERAEETAESIDTEEAFRLAREQVLRQYGGGGEK